MINLICYLIWMLVFPLVWDKTIDDFGGREAEIGKFVLFTIFWLGVGMIILFTK